MKSPTQGCLESVSEGIVFFTARCTFSKGDEVTIIRGSAIGIERILFLISVFVKSGPLSLPWNRGSDEKGLGTNSTATGCSL